ERIAARELAGKAPLDTAEVTFALRSEGAPYVWPRAWTLLGELDDGVERTKLGEWFGSLDDEGERRCAVATLAGEKGRGAAAGAGRRGGERARGSRAATDARRRRKLARSSRRVARARDARRSRAARSARPAARGARVARRRDGARSLSRRQRRHVARSGARDHR